MTDPSKETDIQTLDTDTACFEHVSPSPRVGNDMDLLSSKNTATSPMLCMTSLRSREEIHRALWVDTI